MRSPCVAIVPAMDAYTLDLSNAETKQLVRALADRIIEDPCSYSVTCDDLPESPVPVGDK
jgi:hypothetical protein